MAERIMPLDTGLHSEYSRPDPWRSMVSDRNLLELQRPALWALPIATKDGAQDTIRVLAIRIEFQPDNTTRTTGDGTFDLSPRDEAEHPFDPPPHNRDYFIAHMIALQNYYLAVSDSQLYIDFEVFPDEDTLAYRLPDSMGYYGELGWMGYDMADRMQQFFKDSWELAIRTGDFDIDDFDAHIIFHAGSDWQNDVGSLRPDLVEIWPDIFIPSPDDLPTGYLKLPFTIGGRIVDGIIMPEQAWQDGQIVCINGALAHEFGHQLGLVDLYNTGNFITQVGDFSLMDNGFAVGAEIGVDEDDDGIADYSYPVYGMFPAYPCAWDRAYLGWETPVEITEDTAALIVECCELPSNDGVILVKIPINSYEYFLIENRQDTLTGDNNFLALDQDDETGVILGAWAVDTTRYTTALDYLTPGNGLLIWHIDETVAYGDVDGNGINNFEDNTLQWDIGRRFIALEEADGYEDLGTIVTYGERVDYFFYPNNTNFAPGSNPSSAGNDGGATGIRIDSIGYSGEEMHIRIRFDQNVPSAKTITTVYPLYAPLVAADLDGDYIDEILTESYVYDGGSYKACVLIWNADGEPFIENGYTISGVEYDGSLITVPYPVAAILDVDRITLPAVGDIDGDGAVDLVAIDTDGDLHAWNPRSISGDYMAELAGFPVDLDTVASRSLSLWNVDFDSALEVIAFSNEKVYVMDGADTLFTWDARGEITGIAPSNEALFVLAKRDKARLYSVDWGSREEMWNVQLPSDDVSYLCRADFDGDGEPMEVACAARSGEIYCFDSDGNPLDYFPGSISDTSLSSPIPADFDGDGEIELVMASRTGLQVFEPNGFQHENNPFEADGILSTPIFTGEDILVPSYYGVIEGFDKYGRSPDYFPLNAATSNAAPCLFRDPNGEIGLALGSTNGSLLIWHGLIMSLAEGAWPMWGADAAHTFYQPMICSEQPLSDELGIESFYCYPNPAEKQTIFRYRINSTGEIDVAISVFDAIGNLIAEFEGPPVYGTPAELEWNTETVGSGIYWARLSVSTGADEVSEMFRVAIVK